MVETNQCKMIFYKKKKKIGIAVLNYKKTKNDIYFITKINCMGKG